LSLFNELKRRNVFKVSAAYIIVGWLLLQVSDTLVPALHLPDWFHSGVAFVLILGFPVTIIFAWAYELTPDGIRRERDVDRSQSVTSRTGRKLDFFIIGMLVIVAGYFIWEARFASQDPVPAEASETVVEQSLTALESPPMLAVLPFVSASLEGDSEFFATGVHDDLLTQLAQLQSIRVISRTSVLEYRNTDKNIREIGKELGADAILEGGVQSASDQIRINVQLIDARTDEHLWAQTYDRELSPASIFDVQTEIARAITTAMRATLTEQDAEQLTALPTENMAAYRAYHRALDIRDSLDFPEWMPAFRQALEEAVALDPAFTRAWAELAGILSFENFSQEDPESIERAEQVLEQIRTLAPKSADYLIAQAYYTYYILRNYDRAEQLITQAQNMSPSDARLVELKSWIQRRQGNFEGMIESERLAHKLDPRNPRWTDGLVRKLMYNHRYDDARMEISNSAFQIYAVSYWDSVLRLGEHRDLGRWAEAVAELHEDFEDDADPVDLWKASIATRDYAGAEKILNAMQGPDKFVRLKSGIFDTRQWIQVVTYRLMQGSDRLAETLAQARLKLEERRSSGEDMDQQGLILDMALIAAVEGDTEEAERLVRRWRRIVAEDLAELVHMKHHSCRVLGMAGATAAAVECIRTGLVEPSYVMPFMEPFLPYYDSIRDEPEFVEMLADLGDKADNL
jgi:TolB-like protein/Tfp pilus assembly protein PilF